ncbi:unnamed protein product, partial [Closterium sp. NIES-53]
MAVDVRYDYISAPHHAIPPPLMTATVLSAQPPLLYSQLERAVGHGSGRAVRDDVLLHCPSSVRTLVKCHVYSRFINSSYIFAGTSNVFRVSPPPHLVLTPPLTSPLACGPPTCFVNSSYLFAGTSNIFRESQHLP